MCLELVQAYSRTPIGEDALVVPDGRTLEDFQIVVAAAQAWALIRHIHIVEFREREHAGRRLVEAVRFRRLK